jgi:hypothetical protein
MSKYIGKISSVGIGKEAISGTPVAPTFWVPVTSKDSKVMVESVKDDSDFGIISEAVDEVPVYSKSEPSIEGYVYDKSIGLLLLATLGSAVTTPNSPEAGVNTHVFSLLNNVTHPSLSLAFKDPNEDYVIPYSKLSKFSLNFETKNFLTYSAEFIGKKQATSVNVVAYTAENKFDSRGVTFKLANDVAGLGAAPTICLATLKLDIEKDLEEQECLGGSEPTAIFNKTFTGTMEFEILLDSLDFKGFFLNGTKKACEIKVTSPAIIGLVTNPSLTIVLPSIDIDEIDVPYENGDIVRATYKASVLYSLTDSKMIEATLVNTQLSY